MWVGKVNEFENCKILSDEVKTSVLNFFKQNNLKELPNGRYQLENGDYVNIFEYETDIVEDTFEMHKQSIDIHYVIVGTETLRVGGKEVEFLEEYNEQEDYCLCKTENPDKFVLMEENLCVCLVDEPHQPCGIFKRKMNVKKAVFKIKNC